MFYFAIGNATYYIFSGHVSQCYNDDESATTDQTGITPTKSVKGRGNQLGRRGTYPLINRGRRRSSVAAEKINISLLSASEEKCIPKTSDEAQRIQDILSKVENILFKVLDQSQMTAVQNAMFLVEKTEGDIIIKQGDEGDNFYIIDSGTVSAYVQNTVNMNPPGELVRQYGEGDSFGELAILYNAPRAATCIATSPVVRLWALDRVSFKLILVKNSLAKQAEYIKFLKQVSIFAQLTECELLTVADALEEKVFSENEVVCAQGDVGDSFYIIVDGIAVCSIQDASGSVKEVARLSKGSYFGEVSDLFPSKMLNVS
jgi:cAMP-dependent protein kinase regulator